MRITNRYSAYILEAAKSYLQIRSTSGSARAIVEKVLLAIEDEASQRHSRTSAGMLQVYVLVNHAICSHHLGIAESRNVIVADAGVADDKFLKPRGYRHNKLSAEALR